MPDATQMSFSEASLLALGAGTATLTDAQAASADNIFSGGDTGFRARLLKRAAYNKFSSDGSIPAGTAIDAVPWGNLIQLLMTLLPTLIPLICPPTPAPSVPASGGT